MPKGESLQQSDYRRSFDEGVSDNQFSPEVELLRDIAALNKSYKLVTNDSNYGNFIRVDGKIKGQTRTYDVTTSISLHDNQLEFVSTIISSKNIEKLLILEMSLNAYFKGKFSIQKAADGTGYVVLSTLFPIYWVDKNPQVIQHILLSHAQTFAEVHDAFINSVPENLKLAKGMRTVFEFLTNQK